jgi:hypothetical protein
MPTEGRAMNQETSPTAKRAAGRYARDMIVAGVLYSASVVGGVTAIEKLDLPQAGVIVIALLPLLPALLMLRAYVTFLSGIDEFQRRIQTEAILASAALVGFGSFAYGFLEEWAGFPHLPLIWVLPALIAFWGMAAAIIRLRYK